MGLVKIDPISLEPVKTLFDLVPNHCRAQVDINFVLFILFGFCLAGFVSVEKLVALFFVPDHAALSCEHHLVA